MRKREKFYLSKLEWLSPILVRGFRLLSTIEALGQEFSFSQAMVLQTMMLQKEMKMTELADYLGLSKANATGLVDRLVQKRLVSRRRSVSDRRVVMIKLSPAGQDTARQLAARLQSGLVQMMRRMPERNLRIFIDTLEQIAVSMVEGKGVGIPAPPAE